MSKLAGENVDARKIGSWQEVFERTCSDRVKKAIDRAVETPQICLEHARAEMKVYEECKDDPRIIQRAKVFKQYLEDRTIFITEGELIVGHMNSKQRGSTYVGELYNVFMQQELDDPEKDFSIRDFDRHIISEEERKELREVIFPYFQGKTLEEHLFSMATDDVKEKGFLTTASCKHIPPMADLLVRQDPGHMLANYEKVLRIGLKGIRDEAVMYMEQNRQPYRHFGVEAKEDFYQAVLITLDAAIAHAERYAKLADDMAEKEENPQRKKELERIAQNCRHVPANGARDWWEALQSVWMLQVLMGCEQINYANSFGRFDQYMYPYYEKSIIEEKEFTRDEALELLEMFFVKTAEFVELYDYQNALVQAGYPISQTFIVGGQTKDGKDACNDLTMLCLEAEEQVGLIQPEFAVRVWEGTPEKVIKKACEIIRLGRGKPKFYMDGTGVKMMQKAYPDLSEEDCRDYAVIGCVEIALPHITMQHSFTGLFNLPKVIELTMYNGKCAVCGEQIGPTTGDPRKFESIEQFKQAFRTQTFYWTEQLAKAIKIEMKAQGDMMQIPFASALIEGPLQKGKDIQHGGAWYTSFGCLVGGVANAGDSIAAIDELIYKSKKLTWDQLLEATKANFEGYEDIRQMCINETPKYGNDDDVADSYTAFAMDTWIDSIDWVNTQKHLKPDIENGDFRGAILIGNGAASMGSQVGALPDGRQYPNPLSDTMSPVQGRDINGTSAVIKSVAKCPAHRYMMGTALNQRLTPQLVATERDIDNFVSYIRTAEELGVFHVQFNVITSAVLRKALEEPEKYKDLLVRVASYCSYFIELDTVTQWDIIHRTEHENW